MEIIKANLPTKYWNAIIYWFLENQKEHCCLVFWDIQNKENILCRVHSSCLTWDVFHSLKCDCWEQLDYSLKEISKFWWILIYLSQEWRDIGLFKKIEAYSLQDKWLDTIEANEELKLPIDWRNYKIVKEVLESLNIRSIQLMTNNPDKIKQLKECWIKINWIMPVKIDSNNHNEKYLNTKKGKMQHYL